jgi:malate dehydrogenase (oxaloacetate-decarboxylating)
MPDIYQESLELHEQHHGKLETTSKVPLKDRTDLARAYTPGVAAVCTAISNDKHLAYKYTIKANTVAVVTDGSAILGLGNLGPEAALPVMEGKAILFKQFGGVDAFPICLDTQNVEEIIKAVKLIAPVFGGINLEDISAPRCFEIEERLRNELDIPVMHDDQHGTATVVLAALINALKVKSLEAKSARVVLSGAGAAGTAITKMLLAYGFADVVVCDSRGIVSHDRADLNTSKKALADITNPSSLSGGLSDALKGADIFIGVSAPGVLKPEMVRQMNPKPIIFALANPVPEIMPEEAHAAGAYVVATGRSDFPNQVNNVLVFPGVFRGALAHGVKRLEKSMLVQAAKNLAACVTSPDATHILPDPFDPEVAKRVADAIR